MINDIYEWVEYVVYHNDGWGYRISEGDEGEVVVYYFEGTPNKECRQVFRTYKGHGEKLCRALIQRFHTRDRNNDFAEYTTTIEHKDGWGYIIKNGDVSELVIQSYEEREHNPEHIVSEFSLFDGMGQKIVDAMLRKLEGMK